MNTQFKDDKHKCTPKMNDMIKLIGNHRNSNYNPNIQNKNYTNLTKKLIKIIQANQTTYV